MRIRNIKTGKSYKVSDGLDELYLEGLPAIINGELTVYFEEVKTGRKRLNYINDRMFHVDDRIMLDDLDALSGVSRQELIKYVIQTGANKYINTLRANVNIIRQLRALKETIIKRSYAEVSYDR